MQKSRLLLFDIDGTLILSGGKGQQSMVQALSAYTGRDIDFSHLDFAGSTDRQIVKTLLSRNGFKNKYGPADEDAILQGYLKNLQQFVATGPIIEILPGVSGLLEYLAEIPQVHLGLVTGNLIDGARIKLGSVDLFHYFPIGGFGSDSVDRNQLPPAAIRRAETHFGKPFSSEQVWIIGDTPRDIACAQANDLRSLAVATGHWKAGDLEDHNPTKLVNNLTDTAQIAEILLS